MIYNLNKYRKYNIGWLHKSLIKKTKVCVLTVAKKKHLQKLFIIVQMEIGFLY